MQEILGSILGSGRFPGGRHGNPLQYSCMENPHGQGSLVGYSPQGHKESDMTEQLRTAHTGRHKGNRQEPWGIGKPEKELAETRSFWFSESWAPYTTNATEETKLGRRC